MHTRNWKMLNNSETNNNNDDNKKKQNFNVDPAHIDENDER